MLLHLHLFERGRIQGLKTVRNYKIGPLFAELGSYFCKYRVLFGSGERLGIFILGGSQLTIGSHLLTLRTAKFPLRRRIPDPSA